MEPRPCTGDQHDAYNIAAWLQRADHDGSLAAFPKPDVTAPERVVAEVEGWILGVPGLTRQPVLDSDGIQSNGGLGWANAAHDGRPMFW
jgi:hypothetical protein